MAGVIDMDAARALVADRTRWPRVRDFLFDFPSRIHPSRLESAAFPDWIAKVAQTARAKKHILDFFRVEPFFHTFPADDGSRIALLDFEDIDGAARWLGALSAADALRRTTAGAQVRALKAAFPGVYPGVFAYTAYFRGGNLPKCDSSQPDDIAATGYGIVAAALSRAPAPLLRRFRLVLPEREAAWFDSPSRDLSASAAVKSVGKILKLKFPEAFAVCCS